MRISGGASSPWFGLQNTLEKGRWVEDQTNQNLLLCKMKKERVELWQRRAGPVAALVGAVSSEEKLLWAIRRGEYEKLV